MEWIEASLKSKNYVYMSFVIEYNKNLNRFAGCLCVGCMKVCWGLFCSIDIWGGGNESE